MNSPLSWIKDYVPGLECTDKEYYDRMTLSGTKVEGWKRLDKNLENIVVGKVMSIEKHPNADHLLVCQVDVGTKTIQICTSATNLKVGDVVPVCMDGGRVAGGHDGGPMPEEGIKIKAGKMRGEVSDGMMCGIEELGSSRDMYPEAPEDGIYVFPADDEPALGSDAVEALGLHDTNFEYEITSNRVDCYSMLGIAREAAVTFDRPFRAPEVRVKEEGEQNTPDMISVDVQDRDLCTRYIARVCTNVKLGPSPKWMQRRLANFGIRPINNLVDITNFVMMEYGQPMHAYDYDTIHGHKIIVRRAKDGEKFTTLDGQEHVLDGNILMINDADRAVGIAGIMGGEDSMITENVHTVLFEAATFNGPNIRKSAKRLGMRTDASAIFEKGLDPYNAEAAMDRACQLMEELGCGTVCRNMVDIHDELPALRRIVFEPDKINAYLGTDVSRDNMLTIFRKLELGYDEKTNEIVVPSFRQDLKAMCDLSEEVARFTGYDKVPSTLPSSSATKGGLTAMMKIEDIARSVATEYGYDEAQTFSFESPKVFENLKLAEDDERRKAIRISNPLGEDFSVMRTTPYNGMLTSLATNFARRNKNVKLFEIARVYIPGQPLPITDYPDERSTFSFGFYGDGDFYTMKGMIEDFLQACGMHERMTVEKSSENFLHPGRQAYILYDGERIGEYGEVHPDVTVLYGITDHVYMGMADLKKVLSHASFAHHYEGIAKFPAMSRDISMVVPENVTAGQIEAVIEQRGGKILENYELFDIYEGAQITKGYKSMAYSLTFRHKDRTLEAQEVDKAMKKILNGLEDLGIQLRS